MITIHIHLVFFRPCLDTRLRGRRAVLQARVVPINETERKRSRAPQRLSQGISSDHILWFVLLDRRRAVLQARAVPINEAESKRSRVPQATIACQESFFNSLSSRSMIPLFVITVHNHLVFFSSMCGYETPRDAPSCKQEQYQAESKSSRVPQTTIVC